MWYRLMSEHEMSGRMTSRKGIGRRAVDRPPWNKVYEDLPDTGDRPNTETASGSVGLTPHHFRY